MLPGPSQALIEPLHRSDRRTTPSDVMPGIYIAARRPTICARRSSLRIEQITHSIPDARLF